MVKSGSEAKVLVVDDDEQVRKLLSDLLIHDGYLVDAAANATDAIRLLLRNRYVLLITDVEMPVTSGMELSQEVRARGLRLPILVVSGSPESIREATLLNIGLAESLAKPFSIEEVRAVVARLLAAADEENSDTPTPQRYSPG